MSMATCLPWTEDSPVRFNFKNGQKNLLLRLDRRRDLHHSNDAGIWGPAFIFGLFPPHPRRIRLDPGKHCSDALDPSPLLWDRLSFQRSFERPLETEKDDHPRCCHPWNLHGSLRPGRGTLAFLPDLRLHHPDRVGMCRRPGSDTHHHQLVCQIPGTRLRHRPDGRRIEFYLRHLRGIDDLTPGLALCLSRLGLVDHDPADSRDPSILCRRSLGKKSQTLWC